MVTQTFLQKLKRRYLKYRDPVRRLEHSSVWRLRHFNIKHRLFLDRRRLDLVAIATNNPEVIYHQARLLKKYLKDQYYYTVVDNSPIIEKSKKIKKICRRQHIGYIRLPLYPHIDPSIHHGRALNWAHRNFIQKRQLKYFGFLDHDIFPTRPTSIVEILKIQSVYGWVQTKGSRWYMWPGFCFFTRHWAGDKMLNFLPYPGLDTGGSNWKYFKSINKQKLIKPLSKFKILRGSGRNKQADKVQYISDWLHVINASNWAKTRSKDNLLAKLLEPL